MKPLAFDQDLASLIPAGPRHTTSTFSLYLFFLLLFCNCRFKADGSVHSKLFYSVLYCGLDSVKFQPVHHADYNKARVAVHVKDKVYRSKTEGIVRRV